MECTPIHHHRRGVTELFQPLHQVTEAPGFSVLETAPHLPAESTGGEGAGTSVLPRAGRTTCVRSRYDVVWPVETNVAARARLGRSASAADHSSTVAHQQSHYMLCAVAFRCDFVPAASRACSAGHVRGAPLRTLYPCGPVAWHC
jgi:hypothetical protein